MYRLNRRKLFILYHEAYYFVDDVSLIQKIDSSKIVKVVTPAITENKKDSLLLAKKELKQGDVIRLKSIFFETGKSDLIDDSYPELDKLVDVLEKHPGMEIMIGGNTDSQGNEEANIKLSEARAKAVFDYLIEKGIGNEIDFKGYGSSKPIAGNDTEEGRRKNRRVEFEITKQ